MKYFKWALLITLGSFILQLIASFIVSHRLYGGWHFSDYYSKSTNWIILGLFFISSLLSGINKDRAQK